MLKHKSQTQFVLEQFCTMVETQFSKKIKTLRSDNGTEFFMKDFFAKKGILHHLSCVETPQQNAIVERKHQHILNVAKALMFQSHLPLHLWGHAILAVVYLINRIPSSALSNKIPFEVLFGHPPSYAHLKVFGCLCFASTLSSHKSKFAPRAIRCVFLGYPFGVKGYKVLDLTTNRAFIFRDVVFHENSFLFASVSTNVADPFIPSVVEASCFASIDGFVTLISIPDFASLDFDVVPSSSTFVQPVPIVLPSNATSSSPIQVPNSDQMPPSSPLVASVPPVSLRKSTSDIRPPAYLQDYACTVVATGAPYNLAQCLTYSHLEPCYHSYLLAVSSSPKKPQSFSQAIQDPLWRVAMDKEIQALEKNHTWDVTSLPPGKSSISCKWVYKVKLNLDGSVERFKARLVAKGYTQREGLDFLETFSSVAKIVSMKVLLALIAAKQWPLHQLDINNAFLHGDLDEEVYMTLPPSFHSKGECVLASSSTSSAAPRVCKLVKSLYGLRQASRQWYTKLLATIKQLGFVQSQADYSLFVHSKGSLFTTLLVYVDDMVITGNDHACVASLKSVLD